MAAGHAVLASFVAVVLVAGANLTGIIDREGGCGDASSFDFGEAAAGVPSGNTEAPVTPVTDPGAGAGSPSSSDPIAETTTTAMRELPITSSQYPL